jgi:hypothetical protein
MNSAIRISKSIKGLPAAEEVSLISFYKADGKFFLATKTLTLKDYNRVALDYRPVALHNLKSELSLVL